MSLMASPKAIDLDAQLGIDYDTPVPTKLIKMFGRQWNIKCDLNTFALSDVMSGDAGALARFIRNAVIDEEVADFAAALGKVPNLDAEMLGKILNALVETAAERPTVSPSPVRRTAGSQTSGRKSTAR